MLRSYIPGATNADIGRLIVEFGIMRASSGSTAFQLNLYDIL